MLKNGMRVKIVAVNPLDEIYGKFGTVVGTSFKDSVIQHKIVLLDEPMQNGDSAIAITEACLIAVDLESSEIYA